MIVLIRGAPYGSSAVSTWRSTKRHFGSCVGQSRRKASTRVAQAAGVEVLLWYHHDNAFLAHAALPVHVFALSASLGRAFPCGRTAASGPSRARLELYCASDRLATLASLVVVLRQPPDMVHIPLSHLWLQLGMHIGMGPVEII